MAGNGIKLGVGIDLSQFQKDLSYVNKQLNTIAGQQAVINLKLNLPKGKLKKEFEAAQNELKSALGKVQSINIGGAPINITSVKDANKALKTLNQELKAAQRLGDVKLINDKSNSIAQINQYVDALGRMSNALAQVGLASTPKVSAVNKSERAELDKQIKLLEKRKSLLSTNPNLSYKEKLREEQSILRKLIDLYREREMTYRSGSSKAGSRRIAELQKELTVLQGHTSMFSRMVQLARQYFTIFTFFRVGQELIEATKFFEQQRVALEGIVGSASEAAKAMSGLKQMALESPFELKNLVGYTKQLSAYGIAVEELLPTTNKLADLSAGLGVDMSRLILAYGQVNAASVLRGQELRQFTEAGVPLVEKLSEKFTELNGKLVTTGEVFEMISKRQVSFEMVAQVLSDMTSEGGEFYKMQENLTDTLYGQIEKLKDTWTIELNNIGSSWGKMLRGVVEMLQTVVKNLPLLLSSLATAGIVKLFSLMSSLSASLKANIMSSVAALRTFNRSLRQTTTLGNKLKLTFKGLGSSLKSNVIIAALSLIGGAIANAIIKSREWKKELEDIDSSFAKDTIKYTSGFQKLVSSLSMAVEGTKEYNDAIETLKSNYGDYVNDSLIEQLVKERQQLQNTAEGWGLLHDSIVAAIHAKKEYERHEARKTTAADSMVGEFQIDKLLSRRLNELIDHYSARESSFNEAFGIGYTGELAKEAREHKETYKGVLEGIKTDDAKVAFTNALTNFFEYGETEMSELESRLKDSLGKYSIDKDVSDYILSQVGNIFEKITKSKKWDTYITELGILESDPYTLINNEYRAAKNRAFNTIEGRWTDGMDNKDYNPFHLSIAEDYEISVAAKNLIDSFLGKLANEDINDSVNFKKAKEQINEAFGTMSLESFQNDAGKTKSIADAMNALFMTIKDPDLRAQLSAITNSFIELAGTKTGRAKSISSAIISSYGVNSDADKYTKEFMNRYLPNDQNIDELRNAIAKEISSIENTIKGYGPEQENAENKKYVDELKRDLALFNILAGEQFYDIDEEEKKSSDNKYTRIRITNFFDDLLDLVKYAEDQTKKIVGVTGYTTAMGSFVNSLDDENLLKEFFSSEGNPFKTILDKMAEYGVTEFLPNFDANTLRSILISNTDGGQMYPDFKGLYSKIVEEIGNQVINDLKSKRSLYAEGTSEYNSLDSAIKEMQDLIVKATKEMETRWGGDEIVSKIEQTIKELTDINKNMEQIARKRDIYERLGQSGTYVEAAKAIYGADKPVFIDETAAPINALKDMLALDNVGIRLKGPGARLSQMLGAGSLNIKNISALLEIIKELEEQVKSIDGSDAEEFKSVTKTIVNALNDLIEGILSEEDKWKELTPELDKLANSLSNIHNEFLNGQNMINEKFDSGEINKDEYDAYKIEALQKAFNDTLSLVGGQELPNWVTRLFKDGSSDTGVSSFGTSINNLLGDNNLEQMLLQSLTEGYQGGEFGDVGSEEAMGKFTELSSNISSYIAVVDAVIKAVYKFINTAVELGNQMLDILDKTDNRLNLKSGADGKLYDEDGNLRNIEGYYERQNQRANSRMILDTIGTFNQHIMDGWDKLKSGDILGAVQETIMSIADLVADIFGFGDAQRRQQQERLTRSNENLSRSMESLTEALNDAAGIDMYDIQEDQIRNLKEQKDNYDKLLSLENSMKSGDPEKAQEFADGAIEATREIQNLYDEIQQSILSTANDLASRLTDPLVSAFREGKNAARAWRDAVQGYIGDVLKDVLMTKVIAPKIQEVMDDFFGDTTGADGILSLMSDEDKVSNFVSALNMLGTDLIDNFEELPEGIQDLISFNGGTSSLSGGIGGITEDTARQLEGLANSQLMQLIMINKALTQYLEMNRSYDNSYMANIQTHVQQINNNVSLILRSITELRDTSSRPLHVTIS